MTGRYNLRSLKMPIPTNEERQEPSELEQLRRVLAEKEITTLQEKYKVEQMGKMEARRRGDSWKPERRKSNNYKNSCDIRREDQPNQIIRRFPPK